MWPQNKARTSPSSVDPTWTSVRNWAMSRGSCFSKFPLQWPVPLGLRALGPACWPHKLVSFSPVHSCTDSSAHTRRQLFQAFGTSFNLRSEKTSWYSRLKCHLPLRYCQMSQTLNLGLVKRYTYKLLHNPKSHWNVIAKFCFQHLRLAASRISVSFVSIAKNSFFFFSVHFHTTLGSQAR